MSILDLVENFVWAGIGLAFGAHLGLVWRGYGVH